MFQVCDVVLVNKIDVLPYFDFDMDKCREYVALRNPQRKVIPSAPGPARALTNGPIG